MFLLRARRESGANGASEPCDRSASYVFMIGIPLPARDPAPRRCPPRKGTHPVASSLCRHLLRGLGGIEWRSTSSARKQVVSSEIQTFPGLQPFSSWNHSLVWARSELKVQLVLPWAGHLPLGLEAPSNPAPTPLQCPRSPRHQRELHAHRRAGETPAASQSAPCELLNKGEGDISRRPSIPCDSREHRLPRRYRGAQETRLCSGRSFLIPRPSRFSARGGLTKRCLSLGPAERFSGRETL